jgi:hypothetical protein
MKLWRFTTKAEPIRSVHDPAFRAVEPLMNQTMELVETVLDTLSPAIAMGTVTMGDEGHTPEQLYDEIDDVSDRLYRLSVTPSFLGRDDVAVAGLALHFEEFEKLFRELDELLEKAFTMIGSTSKAEELSKIRADFNTIGAIVQRLTPTHFVLQKHFRSFLYGGPGGDWPHTSYHDALFVPLAQLRDEYFLRPRVKLLTKYLAFAESVTAKATYAEGVNLPANVLAKARLTHAESVTYAVELETMILLDGLH